MTDELARLRRQLRATTAVNRQLKAQLDEAGARPAPPRATPRRAATDMLGPPLSSGGSPARRASVGTTWLEHLALLGSDTDPFLVRAAGGATYLVEGRYQRRVKSGLIVAALEQRLGASRPGSAAELAQWVEGPPVEALECSTGPPFLVIGRRRVPLRGLPVTYPVDDEAAQAFDDGSELAISIGALAQDRVRRIASPTRLLGRIRRSSTRHGGLVPALVVVLRRATRRAKREIVDKSRG
jgi:hypothetical protein